MSWFYLLYTVMLLIVLLFCTGINQGDYDWFVWFKKNTFYINTVETCAKKELVFSSMNCFAFKTNIIL